MQKRSPQTKGLFAIWPNPSGLCMCGRMEHIEKRWGHYRQTNPWQGF